ncbi:MAG: protein-disulfide reductase DsbD family protein, partial [Gammaproteobacteria bacterium]|nr:protein-disulfide reductase DsbD family protein [Gammaproteobacteria bacterium]
MTPRFKRISMGACIALLATQFSLVASAAERRTEYSTVDLIAETASLPGDGGAVTVGIYLKPDPKWHAYWINPGDAGKEVSMRWTLPEGFEAGELQYPAPHVIPFDIFNTYGFDEAILLLADVTVPALEGGGDVELKGRASWVVCDDELCVPERADLSITLPVDDGGIDPHNAPRFEAARAKQPKVVDWPARFEVVDGSVNVGVALPHAAMEPYLFVATKRLVRYDDQSSAETPFGLQFSAAAGTKADRIEETEAVLSYRDADGADRSVLLEIAKSDGALSDAMAAAGPVSSGGAGNVGGIGGAEAAGLGLLTAIFFGLLGGIILNLMPCVFPILSMKALSLVELSGADRKTARSSGIFYTVGILVAFAAIAITLIALREAGSAAGWGFQMQTPLVNLGLGLLMVAIALNLAGVYEFGLRMMGIGQSLTADGSKSERRKSFFTGLLAVVVATPCTAPFMAGAIGYALAQPTAVALAVFLALGLGLALPYLLLSFAPGLGRLLPKPGPWMAKFRGVLAFPMLLAALWLFWIVGRQLGASSMGVAILAALLLAFALWAYGQAASAKWRPAWYATAIAGLAACITASVVVEDYRDGPQLAGDVSAGTLGKLELEHFTPERVLGYIDEGQPVFVYFTADWCLSCKANERAALATDSVGDAMNERGIKVVEADWTSEDPTITDWLEMYDRVGVPLYLYFPKGSTAETAAVLPQLLLPQIVIDAIDAAD